MHDFKIKLGGMVLVSALFVAGFSPTQASATAPKEYIPMSSSYKSSPFYQKLMDVQLTGNQVLDLINVASSQLGYHESNSSSNLTGTQQGSKNWTEYGRLTGTNGYPWCANFVSWCFREANIPLSIFPTSSAVSGLNRSVNNNGATWHSVNSGYKPKAGDVITYESMGGNYSYYKYASRDSKGVPSLSSHVGIVVSDFDEETQTYCVIDGNGSGGMTKLRLNQSLYIPVHDNYGNELNRVQGFITPAYTSGAASGYTAYQSEQAELPSVTLPEEKIPEEQIEITEVTDLVYATKQDVSFDDATAVCRIVKPEGLSISHLGLILYSEDGRVLKDFCGSALDGQNDNTELHAWYRIKEDLGVTLTPNTTYNYQFYAVANGKTFRGSMGSFRTDDLSNAYLVRLDPAGGKLDSKIKYVSSGDVYGDLPTPTRTSYTFLGWFTAKNGGEQITADTPVNLTEAQTLYAQWRQTVSLEKEQQKNKNSSGSSNKADDTKESLISFHQTERLDENGVVTITEKEPRLNVQLTKPVDVEIPVLNGTIYYPNGNRAATFHEVNALSQIGKTTLQLTCTLPADCLASLKPDVIYSYEFSVVLDDETYTSERWNLQLADSSLDSDSESENTTNPNGGFTSVSKTEPVPEESEEPNTSNTSSPTASDADLKPETEAKKTPVKSSGHTATFCDTDTLTYFGEFPVANGEKFPLPDTPVRAGYIFDGWETATGTKITSDTIAKISSDIMVFATWKEDPSGTAGATMPEVKVNDTDGSKIMSSLLSSDPAYIWAVEQGILTDDLKTDNTCSRGQALAFLWKVMGSPESSQNQTFQDVKEDAAYLTACHWAAENGILSGSYIWPESSCTRAMAVDFLWRAMGSPESSSSDSVQFSDVNAGSYFSKAVDWAITSQIAAGTSSTTFSPDSDCSIGEFITLLYHAFQNV